MATHKSAIKRNRQNIKRRAKNTSSRSTLKTAAKKVLTSKTKEEALKNLRAAISLLAKAGQKKLIHKKSASRKISRLTQRINKLVA